MSEQVEVDDFLAHFGVRGMKWGKRRAKSESESSSNGNGGAVTQQPKPKMSRNKKIAIAVGVGAVLAIGAAVTVSSMNKNMDVPIDSLFKNKSTSKGQSFVEAARKATAPNYKFDPKTKDKSFVDTIPNMAKAKSSPANDGLTLSPRGSTNSSKATTDANNPNILGNRLNRAGLSPSDLNSGLRTPSAPSLTTLSNLINGGPQVTFNSKTGLYETK
jgi:hypothetical protein